MIEYQRKDFKKTFFGCRETILFVDTSTLNIKLVPYGKLVQAGLPEKWYQGNLYPDNLDMKKINAFDNLKYFKKSGTVILKSKRKLSDNEIKENVDRLLKEITPGNGLVDFGIRRGSK